MNENYNFRIENTKDGYNILKLQTGNKSIYMGSKYNMKSEIDKFMNQFTDITSENIFIICGFATGEHIKALRRKYKKNLIIIFEPINDLKEYIDTLDWVKNDKKIEILYNDKMKLRSILNYYISVFNYNNLRISSYSRYNEIMGEEIKEFLEFIKTYCLSSLISHNTRIARSNQWFKTLMENLEYMISGSPINTYENYFKDKPAIIVSAGPSLDKNIDYLKEIDDEFVLFTGYRNISGLIEKNIYPNFVGVVDSDDILYNLGKESIKYTENIPLIFCEATNDLVVKNHRGKKIYFIINEMLKKMAYTDIIDIELGGSVAHIITSIAIKMGCNPIIFVGQDLACTEERSYSKLIKNQNGNWIESELKSNDKLWVEAYGGGKVETIQQFQSFIYEFEQIIDNNKNIEFINATEGGARIHGTIELPLKEALKKYNKGKIEFKPNFEKPIDGMSDRCIDILDDIEKKCTIIKRQCEKAVKLISKLKLLNEQKNQNEINKIFNDLSKVDKIINENYDDVAIIESLLYPIISKIMGKQTQNIKYKELIEENYTLYNGILQEVDFALDYVKIIKQRLINKYRA